MNPLFLDTGYVLALEIANDQHHEAAPRHWQGLLQSLPPLVSTSYVFDEIVTFLNSRGHHAKAVQVGTWLLEFMAAELVRVDEALFQEGWRFLQGHGDKTYSLTDCISFVVMMRRDMRTALTFDHHFVQAGFSVLPAPETGAR